MFMISTVLAGELRILTVEEPPSSFIGENGEPSGFSVEILQNLQKRLNSRESIKFVPEIRALNEASQSPNIILFSFSRIPEREEKFYWIMQLMRKPWVIYAGKGAGITLRSIEDAKKLKSIGVVRGDVRASYLKQMGFTNLDELSTHAQGLKMLRLKRIQAVFYEPQGMAFECMKLGIPITEFEVISETRTSDVYIMMSKHGTPSETVEKWRKAAQSMKEDGTFQLIAEKWARNIREQYGIFCEVENGVLNFSRTK